MNENEWTKHISDMVEAHFEGTEFFVDTLRKIPYAFEISSFDENWEISEYDKTLFETDLLIYEKKDHQIIPRVIIESKIGRISTHDVITYSHKASYHKNVIPFVRYGIIFGDREEYPLPGRAFRHGTNFDFLFSFVGLEATEKEKRYFLKMIEKEINYSRQLEEILLNSRSKNRKRYFMLQKEFYLVEMNDLPEE